MTLSEEHQRGKYNHAARKRTRSLTLLTISLLLTSCTSTNETPKIVEPQRWSKVDSDLPANVDVAELAGWNAGLVASSRPSAQPQASRIYTSANGEQWQPSSLEGLSNFNDRGALAGHAAAAYVLGTTARGVEVWRTEDGSRWERNPLSGTLITDRRVSIAAGPRGVVVAGPSRAPGNTNSTKLDGFRVWFSPDGRKFDRMIVIPVKIDKLGGTPHVAATREGFLLDFPDSSGPASTTVFASDDGQTWKSVGDGLPANIGKVTNRSGSTTVALTRVPLDGTDFEVQSWRRSDGDDCQRGTVDLGRLPDLGVVPRALLFPAGMDAWGTGYIAYGRAGAPRESVGVMWTSSDGLIWSRTPVRGNGFDAVRVIHALTFSRNETFILGGNSRSIAPGPTFWKTPSP